MCKGGIRGAHLILVKLWHKLVTVSKKLQRTISEKCIQQSGVYTHPQLTWDLGKCQRKLRSNGTRQSVDSRSEGEVARAEGG